MFADLLRRLAQRSTAEPVSAADCRLALSALLVRIARADGQYHDDEIARIDKILAHRYALSPFEATALRHHAEVLEAEAPDTVRFTRTIKDAVPHEDREAVIEAMWAVALADGTRGQEENTMLRLMANLLGINDRDSNLARQRVESRP
ncbi:MAG: TerB family tellurite resistance protein [Paracoccaceae bacterium]